MAQALRRGAGRHGVQPDESRARRDARQLPRRRAATPATRARPRLRAPLREPDDGEPVPPGPPAPPRGLRRFLSALLAQPPDGRAGDRLGGVPPFARPRGGRAVRAERGRWRRRLWLLLRRPTVERAMDDELRYHIECEVAEHVRSGMSAEDARRVALAEFGGIEQIKEDARDARGTRPLEDLMADVAYGARVLRRNPVL